MRLPQRLAREVRVLRQCFVVGSALSLLACGARLRDVPPHFDPASPDGPEGASAPAVVAVVDPAGSTASDRASMAGMRADSAPHEGTASPGSDAAVRYTCPMHPEVVSATPGSCPKCGMTLVQQKPAGKRDASQDPMDAMPGHTMPGHTMSGKPGTPPPETTNGGTPPGTAAHYTCPMHPEVVSPTPGKCPKCGMTLIQKPAAKRDESQGTRDTMPGHTMSGHTMSGKSGAPPPETSNGGTAPETAVRYTCPMHPEVVSPTPGKCPKCGMTLVRQKKPAAKPPKGKESASDGNGGMEGMPGMAGPKSPGDGGVKR